MVARRAFLRAISSRSVPAPSLEGSEPSETVFFLDTNETPRILEYHPVNPFERPEPRIRASAGVDNQHTPTTGGSVTSGAPDPCLTCHEANSARCQGFKNIAYVDFWSTRDTSMEIWKTKLDELLQKMKHSFAG